MTDPTDGLTEAEETVLHLASLRGTLTEVTFSRRELDQAVESIIAERVQKARNVPRWTDKAMWFVLGLWAEFFFVTIGDALFGKVW